MIFVLDLLFLTNKRDFKANKVQFPDTVSGRYYRRYPKSTYLLFWRYYRCHLGVPFGYQSFDLFGPRRETVYISKK